MLVPYDNTYWVKQGAFLAGCYPGTPSSDLIEERLKSLLDSGVSVIISLMEKSEVYSDGTPFVRYDEQFLNLARELGVKAKWYNFPIPDFGLPDKHLLKGILKEIDESIAAGKAVFIHCWGGKGRTGTVVGCWLSRHGDEDPLATLSLLRKDCPNAAQDSPETEAQCNMVRSWQAGE